MFFGVLMYLKFAFAFYFVYSIIAENGTNKFLVKSEKAILYKKGKQEKALMKIQEDLYFLSRLNSVQNWNTESSSSPNDIREFMNTRPDYDHLRILDTNGMEVIRVNNRNNVSELVATENLQNKSHREYYIKSKQLLEREYYVSPISLNQENGKIEVPYKPVFRVTMPIFNQGTKVGYLCINYKLKHLLENFQNNSFHNAHFDLVDSNGELLSQIMGENFPPSLKFHSSELVQKLKKSKRSIDSIRGEKHLFMATPLEWKSSSINNKLLKSNQDSGGELTLIYFMPNSVVEAINNDLFYTILISFLVFSLFYLPTVWILHNQRKKRHAIEVRFQSIFNKTTTFIGLLEPDGTLIEANDTALNFGGFTREQAQGQKFWDAPWWSLSDAIQSQLKTAIQKASKGEEIRYDVDVVGGSGEIITIDFSLRPVFDENGEVFYIIPEGKDITEKVSMQEEIESNNQLYEAVQKLSNTGVWSVDLKAGKLDWDETVYAIHELELGTEVNLDEGINYYREDFRELVQTSIDNAILKNESWDFEAILVTAKGNERWVRALGYPVFEHDKLIALRGTFADIDAERRHKEQLEEKENRLRLALDSAKLGMWDWDLVQDVLNWDDSLYEIYEIQKSDFSGAYEAWKNAVHPDDIEEAHEKVNESIDHRVPLNMTFRIITPTGTIKHLQANASVIVDESGKPVRMIGVNKDVSERVKNETKIRELNANLEDKVLERTAELNGTKMELEQQISLMGVSAMVSETNLKGEIIRANDTFCNCTGFSEEELIGNTHHILNSGIQTIEQYQSLWETISNGGTWQGELCNKKKNGQLYWVHATIQPFMDSQNEISRYVGVYFNITELKESTRKLSEMNAQLDAANRELETFSYSVSHDLKAPLRALQGFSRNVLERYQSDLDETGVRWLHFIQDNASRMDILISDILSYSKIGKAQIKRTEYSMRKLIDEKIESIQEGYVNRPEIIIDSDIPDVSSDRTMIGVIWQNLIDNAFKYSEKKEKPKIHIRAEANRSGVTYFVKDNGSGFDMRHADKLFGIFQRLHSHEEFEGTGVGLANVQRIICKHNGTISATGEVGKGATFQFFLPFKMTNYEH